MIFCTPVDRIAGQILEFASLCSPGTLLTDAGSTKASIVAAVEGKLPAGIDFVGSHPLAGSEKRGPYFADANLFQGRLAVVTRTRAPNPAAAARKSSPFGKRSELRVSIMAPADHDHALAMTSHLPHLVAAALAGILPPEVFDLTATGFRDTTRVAAGDPNLWTAIFAHNTAALLEALRPFSERMSKFQAALPSRGLVHRGNLADPSQKGARCSGKLKSCRNSTTPNQNGCAKSWLCSPMADKGKAASSWHHVASCWKEYFRARLPSGCSMNYCSIPSPKSAAWES